MLIYYQQTYNIYLLHFHMDFLRQIVGGPKNRYKENGYNLDLTYITPRIIAMAFPASGIEKLYRNNIETIAELFAKEHQNKYLTINISGRGINEQILKNVVSYDWQDHKAPPFDMLFQICDLASNYLSEDAERIAVFHCNHGKGRTGTIICCFFLFMGVFQNAKEVMEFYASQRFQRDGYGVTQPCQIQYIKYFESYLKNPSIYPQVISIKKITFKGDFQINNPYIKVIDSMTGKTIYNTHEMETALIIEKQKEHTIKFNKKNFFAGDIAIEVKEDKSFGKNLLISYVFNTAFINVNKNQEKVRRISNVKLKQMSPLGKQKQKNFGPNFQIDIQFKKFCHCGENKNIVGCQYCHGILKDQFVKWQKINVAYKNRQLLLGKRHIICFGKVNSR